MIFVRNKNIYRAKQVDRKSDMQNGQWMCEYYISYISFEVKIAFY